MFMWTKYRVKSRGSKNILYCLFSPDFFLSHFSFLLPFLTFFLYFLPHLQRKKKKKTRESFSPFPTSAKGFHKAYFLPISCLPSLEQCNLSSGSKNLITLKDPRSHSVPVYTIKMISWSNIEHFLKQFYVLFLRWHSQYYLYCPPFFSL